jgi:hypothetical protein
LCSEAFRCCIKDKEEKERKKEGEIRAEEQGVFTTTVESAATD